MKLVYASASPFVRKVHVLLIETGQMADVELLQVTTTPVNTAAEAASANPSGKIPALILADGTALYDSRVICRYLDTLAGNVFYPESRIWEVLTLEATAEGTRMTESFPAGCPIFLSPMPKAPFCLTFR